ncbi:hypothetical protein TNCV_1877091 [Trichonephila clavipes]|nr:hypothetical protein TNCV_1877091 [Trichonephila clavipes]
MMYLWEQCPFPGVGTRHPFRWGKETHSPDSFCCKQQEQGRCKNYSCNFRDRRPPINTQTPRSAGLQKGEISMGNAATLLKKAGAMRAKRRRNRPVRRGKDVEKISKKEILRTKY